MSISHPPPPTRKPLKLAVVGSLNGRLEVFDAPEFRKPTSGEIVEFEGRYWRMVHNHNGQRLRGVDVTDRFVEAQS